MSRIAAAVALPWLVTLGLTGCADAPKPTASNAALSQRLASADPVNGGRIFHQCAACHNLSVGGTDRDGPNLWGVLGRPLATSSPRFAYTAALKTVGGIWTCQRMDEWLKDPAGFAAGTAMIFPGLTDGVQRAEVIAYLAQSGGTISDASCAALRSPVFGR